MTERTDYILNALQAAILAEVRARNGEATFDKLQTTLGISRTPAQREVADLRERGFLTSNRAGDHHKMYHTICDAGIKALIAHRIRTQDEEDVGTAGVPRMSTRNVFELPEYKPEESRAYFRNDGNAHIKSKGAFE